VEKAIIASIVPAKIQAQIGKKFLYCTCGKSKDGALCDGSHRGTSFKPIPFVAQRERLVLCTCKKTKEAPYCSGAHRGLSEEDIGKGA